MPYPVKEFVKVCANSLIDDCSWFVTTATRPISTVAHHIEGVLIEWELESCMKLNRQIARANVYRKFVALQNHYASSPERKGQLVYLFLENIEMLPEERREATIFRAVTFIEANGDKAVRDIAKFMRTASKEGLLIGSNQVPLQLAQ